MKLYPATLAIFLALCANARADKPYMIDGKAIEPACLFGLTYGDSARSEPIDLNNCKPAWLVPDGRAEVKNGTIGYSYHDKNDPDVRGDLYYRYIGQADGHDILILYSWGGGSGNFSNLVGVDHTGSTLRLGKEYASGDRCIGSVTAARIKNGRLQYDVSATPRIFFEIVDKDQKVADGEDLDDVPFSCSASVHYEDGKWTSVEFTSGDPMENDPATPAQKCFDAVRAGYVSRGKLDHKAILEFEKAFAARCRKAAK
jgi:hypothetical protein